MYNIFEIGNGYFSRLVVVRIYAYKTIIFYMRQSGLGSRYIVSNLPMYINVPMYGYVSVYVYYI